MKIKQVNQSNPPKVLDTKRILNQMELYLKIHYHSFLLFIKIKQKIQSKLRARFSAILLDKERDIERLKQEIANEKD